MLIIFQNPSAKTIVSTLASMAATAVILRSVLGDYVPPELQRLVQSKLRLFFTTSFSSTLTLIFEEFVANEKSDADEYYGRGFSANDLFAAAKAYLNPTVLSRKLSTVRFKAILPRKETKITVAMETNQEIVDYFNGVKLTWRFFSSSNSTSQSRFELSFHKKHRDTVLTSYLRHVFEESRRAREESKTVKLFALKQGRTRIIRPRWMATAADLWEATVFDHPATFATVAAPEKEAVMADLERFAERREFYRKVGRAWKRGYLLYGPPGTGKTSLVAAIANYLKFDVYDLELSSVRNNTELRKIVISTGNRSLLVVEDVDCTGDLDRIGGSKDGSFRRSDPRRSEVTLSGLLNFIDGLWSSCGDERIIVLTTNHKDRLDPALLRPGRMDMHIHMSYCTPCGFRMLASNYLGVANHMLFSKIEQLIETIEVTPAEVGEELLKNEDPETSLQGLLKFLKKKKDTEAQSSSLSG